MSRIGKKPILIPDKIEVKVEGQKVIVKGPLGELFCEVLPEIKVSVNSQEILVSVQKETKKSKAFWGLTRALINNMVEGAQKGFKKILELQGIGYKVKLEGEDLVLDVGFTNSVKINAIQGVKFLVEKNKITISGIDKGLVGQIAAKIRKVRPPEPYKGKGIRYEGEQVRKKLGKKAATSTG